MSYMVSEWQEIEKVPVPLDGSWFAICRAGEPDSVEVGCYQPLRSPVYVEVSDGVFRKDMRTFYEWAGFNNMHRATHWMPLPEVPATPQSAKEEGTE